MYVNTRVLNSTKSAGKRPNDNVGSGIRRAELGAGAGVGRRKCNILENKCHIYYLVFIIDSSATPFLCRVMLLLSLLAVAVVNNNTIDLLCCACLRNRRLRSSPTNTPDDSASGTRHVSSGVGT